MTALLWKILGGALLVVVVVGSVRYGLGWKAKAERYNSEVVRLLDAVRIATDNPELQRPDLANQIYVFGTSYDELDVALRSCNDSVSRLASEGARQQREADAALAGALNRKKEADRAIARLEESARNGEDGTCLSEELKRRWK